MFAGRGKRSVAGMAAGGDVDSLSLLSAHEAEYRDRVGAGTEPLLCRLGGGGGGFVEAAPPAVVCGDEGACSGVMAMEPIRSSKSQCWVWVVESVVTRH